jgi:hypothetical protein
MKTRQRIFWEYAPVMALVLVMSFLFLHSTLPSIRMNRFLNRVQAKRLEEIERIREEESRCLNLREALENDPITIENQLRRQFGSAKEEGEKEIDP